MVSCMEWTGIDGTEGKLYIFHSHTNEHKPKSSVPGRGIVGKQRTKILKPTIEVWKKNVANLQLSRWMLSAHDLDNILGSHKHYSNQLPDARTEFSEVIGVYSVHVLPQTCSTLDLTLCHTPITRNREFRPDDRETSKNKKVWQCGDEGNRTLDISHAKRALCPWATSPAVKTRWHTSIYLLSKGMSQNTKRCW